MAPEEPNEKTTTVVSTTSNDVAELVALLRSFKVKRLPSWACADLNSLEGSATDTALLRTEISTWQNIFKISEEDFPSDRIRKRGDFKKLVNFVGIIQCEYIYGHANDKLFLNAWEDTDVLRTSYDQDKQILENIGSLILRHKWDLPHDLKDILVRAKLYNTIGLRFVRNKHDRFSLQILFVQLGFKALVYNGRGTDAKLAYQNPFIKLTEEVMNHEYDHFTNEEFENHIDELANGKRLTLHGNPMTGGRRTDGLPANQNPFIKFYEDVVNHEYDHFTDDQFEDLIDDLANGRKPSLYGLSHIPDR